MSDIFKYRDIVIGTGYFASINAEGNLKGYGSIGSMCMIEYIHRNKTGDVTVDLRSKSRNPNWPGTETGISKEYGISIDIHNFMKCFRIEQIYVTVCKDFKIGSENLKGCGGKLISPIYDYRNLKLDMMIEFDKQVQCGGCADGLGKYGHCLSIPSEVLKIFINGSEIEDHTNLLTSEQNDMINFAIEKSISEKQKEPKKMKKFPTRYLRGEEEEVDHIPEQPYHDENHSMGSTSVQAISNEIFGNNELPTQDNNVAAQSKSVGYKSLGESIGDDDESIDINDTTFSAFTTHTHTHII